MWLLVKVSSLTEKLQFHFHSGHIPRLQVRFFRNPHTLLLVGRIPYLGTCGRQLMNVFLSHRVSLSLPLFLKSNEKMSFGEDEKKSKGRLVS